MVKHKALNLVDVGSSPMVRVTSYDIIFNEKSQFSIILLNRPLGPTLVEVFMSIRQFQVLGCCKHDNPTSRKADKGPGRVSPLVPVQSRTGTHGGIGPAS